MAGVSKGTVDRVLHKRGNVSKEAFEKVDRILKKIDFKPNLIARNLKNYKTYLIGALLPDPNLDPFWIPLNEGIEKASLEFNPLGILVKKYFYDPKDHSSFWEQSQELLNSNPDVLIMVPIFLKESKIILDLCENAKVLAITLNHQISTSKKHLYIGQNPIKGGRVAASLMDRIIHKNDRIGVVHVNKESHMQLKENGFKEYFNEHGSGTRTITSHAFSDIDLLSFNNNVSLYVKENSATSAFYITNSKAYLFLNALQNNKRKDIKVIAHDLLNDNMAYLKKGEIDFLIHQRPYEQAYLSVANIAEHFLMGKKLSVCEFLPIDIITSENADYHF